MEEPAADKDRVVYTFIPKFDVWEAELGHLPFVNVRFERQGGDSEALDLVITAGGGLADDLIEISAVLYDAADILRDAHESAEIGQEDPTDW